MKNRVYKTIFFLLLSLTVNGQAGELCRQVYKNDFVKISVFDVEQIVAKKESPFDVARQNRLEQSIESDRLLDNVEQRLLNEDVVQIEDLGGGVNNSYKITLKSGLQAAYKPVNPERSNQPTREAVAYRLSRLLQLDIVPPTVVRSVNGKVGSVQLFISTAKPLKKGKNARGEKNLIKDDKEFDPDQFLSGRHLRIFDWLINNHDRGSNAGNYLVSKADGYIIGIDHSVSFVGHDKAAREDKVPYYEKEFLMDRAFYDRLFSVSKSDFQQALAGLNPTRIEEFFERLDQLKRDFEVVLGEAKRAG